MVESNSNLSGFYWWGPNHFPDYALGLFDDGTFKVFKSCDEDYDKPMCPFGESYFA